MTPPEAEYIIDMSTRVRHPDTSIWPQQRRQLYLLRQDVDVPYSIDPRVLPVANDALQPEEQVRLVITVAVDGVASTLLQAEAKALNQPLPITDYSLLGYDVCDDARISIVMNFRSSDSNAERQRNVWGQFLNRYHLFGDVASAKSFCKFATTSFREHAPYNVVGLYGVAAPQL